MSSKGKVTEIVANPALKKDGSELKGLGKNGQPWSMSRVKAELDNGTTQEGNIFNPVSVGDELEAEYNEQYSSWNFSKPKHEKPVGQAEQLVINMLKTVVEVQEKHGKLLDGMFKVVVGDDNKIAKHAEETMDDPISLDEIPF